jgi:hypothetical protein
MANEYIARCLSWRAALIRIEKVSVMQLIHHVESRATFVIPLIGKCVEKVFRQAVGSRTVQVQVDVALLSITFDSDTATLELNSRLIDFEAGTR